VTIKNRLKGALFSETINFCEFLLRWRIEGKRFYKIFFVAEIFIARICYCLRNQRQKNNQKCVIPRLKKVPYCYLIADYRRKNRAGTFAIPQRTPTNRQ
jgi:hypothetical protein